MIFSTSSRWARSSRSAGPMRNICASTPVFMRRLRPVMMLSSTLMPRNRARFWKVRATPISATLRGLILSKVWPRKTILPCCGV